eukprot:TRINITY_DN5700_c0_g1_i1.p1 TRINITY_DN5700_c0_g1~~TRINITY_DN5700_c0_g1_i1.p1  ORF type:complete len:710 (+),score=149.17 TRINITY_DN5700_c0_g1_i1:123-2252(+)
MYMVMHFVLGVLGLISLFKASPATAFFVSAVSLLLDFDSFCSIVDSWINGTTVWQDPKYGNFHSVSRCDGYFLGHAMLTHTVLFAVVASALACGVVRAVLRYVRLIDVPLVHCFKMTFAAMMFHLALDLCTFAKDCSEPEHIYLWPLSAQSFHMNCLIDAAFTFHPYSNRMRALRLITEIVVHCIVWHYIFFPLRTVNSKLSTRLAVAALPGYLLEEILPYLMSIPNGWGNTAFLFYLVGFTAWVLSRPEESQHKDPDEEEPLAQSGMELGVAGVAERLNEEVAACSPWLVTLYHEVSTPDGQSWLRLLGLLISVNLVSMWCERRCHTFVCSITWLVLPLFSLAVVYWVAMSCVEAHGTRKTVSTLAVVLISLLSLNSLSTEPASSGFVIFLVCFLVVSPFLSLAHLLGKLWRSWCRHKAVEKAVRWVWPSSATPLWIVACLMVLFALQMRQMILVTLCARPSAKSNAVYPVLQLTEQLLTQAGIDHWMEGGAVLGLLREGKLHRWDIDVDFAVDSAKFAALHAMAKNATLLSSFGLAYKAIEPAAWHAPDMEEFILRSSNGEMLAGSPTGYVHLQSCRHFRPGTECELNGIKSRCPKPEDLSILFASDYQAVCDPSVKDQRRPVESLFQKAAQVVHSPLATLQFEMRTAIGIDIPGWCAAQGVPDLLMVPECSRFEALLLGDTSAYMSGWKGCSPDVLKDMKEGKLPK